MGRTVQINKHPYTILGVAPPAFHGTLLMFFPDFFAPLVNEEQLQGWSGLNDRAVRSVLMVMGHLRSGVTPQEAIADLNATGSYLAKTYPKVDDNVTFELSRPGLMGDFFGGPVRAFLTALMLLAGLILLAACANLGSLFAARTADRARELALRLALGSSPKRILRALFTEAVLISLLGGAVGLMGSVALLKVLSTWQPLPRYPMHVAANPDTNVYLAALLLALLSGLLFALVPVRQVLRTDPYQIVKSGSAATIRRGFTVRDLLLCVQITICAVLVTSSLVAVRGLARSLHSNFGFQPQNAILMRTVMNMAGYTGEAAPAMQKRMLDSIGKIPGVTSVGLTVTPPLSNPSWTGWNVFTDETTDMRASHAAAVALWYSISPDYFQAAGTALLSGRNLTWHDDKDAAHVAVINREFARRLFGSVTNAIGRYYKVTEGTRMQVVGVVEDGKYKNLTEDPQLAMYIPILQWPSSETSMVARSNRPLQQLAPAMRRAMRDLDPGLPCDIVNWNKELDFALFPSRVATVSLGVLGAIGALLSITGIFGMAAYSVSRRLRELGIRMALGAKRQEILGAALGRAFRLLAFGSAAGMVLGILASRVLASIVYQATPRDPLVLAGVILAMAFLGLLATWIPAQRALSLDPLTLLRDN